MAVTRHRDGDRGEAEPALVHQQRGQRGAGGGAGDVTGAGGGAQTSRGRGEEREGGVRVVEVRLGRPRGEQRGVGAPGPRAWRGQLSTVDIQPGVLLFPLCPPVLKPDLDLGLGEVEAEGEVESLAD